MVQMKLPDVEIFKLFSYSYQNLTYFVGLN